MARKKKLKSDIDVSKLSGGKKAVAQAKMLDEIKKAFQRRQKKLDKETENAGKSTRKGVKLKPKSKARRKPLKEMQKEFLNLEKIAMSRVKELRGKKMLGVSRAYQNALETKPKTSKERRPLFYVKDRNSYKALRKEIARMQEFINDISSTIEGARWTAEELELTRKYGGAFGKKWAQINKGKTFDPSRINEEYARSAWKIFRYLEEMKGAYGLMYGEGSYDSESLIISIYDMVVERDVRLDEDGVPFNSSAENFYDTVMDARAKLEYFHEQWKEQAKLEREHGAADSGLLARDNIVMDLLNKANSSRDFLKLLNNL